MDNIFAKLVISYSGLKSLLVSIYAQHTHAFRVRKTHLLSLAPVTSIQ